MENYLQHHGILGMKWGVRRYQNPDGTLTEKGRERYGSGGLTPGTARSFEKKIKNLSKSNEKADRDLLKSSNSRKAKDKQYASNFKDRMKKEKEIADITFGIAEKSKVLKNMLAESKSLREKLDAEENSFFNNKTLFKKTYKEFSKEYGQFYPKNLPDDPNLVKAFKADPDAAGDLWRFYISKNSNLSNMWNKLDENRKTFYKQSQSIVNDLLGSYGDKKINFYDYYSGKQKSTISAYVTKVLKDDWWLYMYR